MEVFGLRDTLLLANRVAAAMEPLLDVRVTSVAGGIVLAAGGLAIRTRMFRASPDRLVIPDTTK